MSRLFEDRITLYGGKAYGHEVSEYGLKNGYLDYRTLSKIVGDMVLNNYIYEYVGYGNWELDSGKEVNEDGDLYDIYQYYIISNSGAQFLADHTDEIIFYNEELDMYLWGITHYGTSWDYVLTDIKLDIAMEGC